jgi:hypothetical protein
MNVNTPPELIEFLYHYDPRIQSLALGVRKLVHAELAPCHEYIFAMRSKVVLLYGSSERVIADGICNIGVFTRHVTIAFPRGVDLKAPHGVLQGTGKGMRHIRMNALGDLERPEIRSCLRQARKLAGVRRRARGPGRGVVTKIKPRSAARSPGRSLMSW